MREGLGKRSWGFVGWMELGGIGAHIEEMRASVEMRNDVVFCGGMEKRMKLREDKRQESRRMKQEQKREEALRFFVRGRCKKRAEIAFDLVI